MGPFHETKGSLWGWVKMGQWVRSLALPCLLPLSDVLSLSVRQGCGNPLRMQIPTHRER